MHWIYLSVLHTKPGGDTILSRDLISENWTPSSLTHTAMPGLSIFCPKKIKQEKYGCPIVYLKNIKW